MELLEDDDGVSLLFIEQSPGQSRAEFNDVLNLASEFSDELREALKGEVGRAYAVQQLVAQKDAEETGGVAVWGEMEARLAQALLLKEEGKHVFEPFVCGFFLAQSMMRLSAMYDGHERAIAKYRKHIELQSERGKKSGEVRRAEGEWGLRIAKRLRQEDPSISTAEIARQLQASDAPPVNELPTYEARVRRWERASLLAKRNH